MFSKMKASELALARESMDRVIWTGDGALPREVGKILMEQLKEL